MADRPRIAPRPSGFDSLPRQQLPHCPQLRLRDREPYPRPVAFRQPAEVMPVLHLPCPAPSGARTTPAFGTGSCREAFDRAAVAGRSSSGRRAARGQAAQPCTDFRPVPSNRWRSLHGSKPAALGRVPGHGDRVVPQWPVPLRVSQSPHPAAPGLQATALREVDLICGYPRPEMRRRGHDRECRRRVGSWHDLRQSMERDTGCRTRSKRTTATYPSIPCGLSSNCRAFSRRRVLRSTAKGPLTSSPATRSPSVTQ
jgi:hypothetical protein